MVGLNGRKDRDRWGGNEGNVWGSAGNEEGTGGNVGGNGRTKMGKVGGARGGSDENVWGVKGKQLN